MQKNQKLRLRAKNAENENPSFRARIAWSLIEELSVKIGLDIAPYASNTLTRKAL